MTSCDYIKKDNHLDNTEQGNVARTHCNAKQAVQQIVSPPLMGDEKMAPRLTQFAKRLRKNSTGDKKEMSLMNFTLP
jgi:hypothetical protein